MSSQSPPGTTPAGTGADTPGNGNGGNVNSRGGSHAPLQLAPGTRLVGTYEIAEHLNTGGMGEVYRAVNIHNDEVVAIKIVLPALAHDDKIFSLFQKESTVLRRVVHDAIVRYEMFTVDPDIGRPCLVMEFVDGIALSDQLEYGAMPEQQVLALTGRLADGLGVAHRAGVVHRDLSPDNVILPGADVASAKIIDFGIAKETTAEGGTLIGGQFAGKPGYVAPEQLGLYEGNVTGQADVYSLGLLIAAAGLGRPLDMGDTPADAVRARMSVPDLAGLPERLHRLVLRMLQPDPADRPDGMTAVVQTIRQMTHAPKIPVAGQETLISTPHPDAAPAETTPDTGTASASPFAPPPADTARSAPVPEAPAPRGRRYGTAFIMVLGLAALALGGAWYTGRLPARATLVSLTGLGGPDLDTQRAWVAERAAVHTGDCRYLQPAVGMEEGAGLRMRGFARQTPAFDALRSAFEEAHDTTLRLRTAEVAPAQCAALDFLAGLSLPLVPDQALALAPDEAAPGGRLTGRGSDAVALLLVDPGGRVQNVTGELSENGAFALPERRMRRGDGPDDAPFLVLALASAVPLDTVSLIPENALLPADQAGEFWRFLTEDIAAAREGAGESAGARAALVAVDPAP